MSRSAVQHPQPSTLVRFYGSTDGQGAIDAETRSWAPPGSSS